MSNIAHEVIKKYVGKPNPKYHNLPNGYTQVQYIQSNEFEYINTKVIPSQNTKLVADFQIIETKYGFETHVIAYWSSNYVLRITVNTNNTFDTNSNKTTFSQTSNIFARTTATAIPYITNNGTGTEPIYIFSQFKNGHSGRIRLYSLQIYESDELTHNFIPCIRDSDGEIGLYNIVESNSEKVFYSNDNVLIDNNNNKYQRVEYIESTGQQRIETDYVANTDTGFYAKFNSKLDGGIFGTCNSSVKQAYLLEGYDNGSFYRSSDSRIGSLLESNSVITVCHSRVLNKFIKNNGTSITTQQTSFTSPGNQFIFCWKKTGVNTFSYSSTALYLMRYYEQYNIVHEYIPCISSEEEPKPGLFDTITKTFLKNSGSGSFLIGQPATVFTAGDEEYPEVATEITDTYISHKILPKNYTQLNYIQNTGLSYFDTDTTVINENTKIEADFQYVDKKYGFESIVSGVWNDSSRCRIGNNADNIFAATGDNTISQTTDIFARTVITATPNTGYNQSNKSITIFCQNNYDTETKLSFYNTLKLYSFKIYDNNELIKHYIPAKYNNKIGLYEIIDGEFKVDQTGVPPEYTQVEYIESTGTQYINTNYIVATSTGFFTRFTTNNNIGNNDYGAIFGNCDDNKNGFFLETYTDELDSTHKGRFHYGSLSTNDPLITPDELMTIGYSYGKQALVRTDNTSVRNITPVEVTNVPLYLFACNNNNTEVLAPSRTKLYSFIILEGVRVIHNYVPVISTTNNQIIPGLYDTTIGEFLTNSNNQGSDFLYGNIVTENLISGEEIPPVARKVVKTYIGA